MEKLTYILLAIIVILAFLMVMVCRSSKSPYGATNQKTSIKPEMSDATVLIFYAPWCGHCKSSKAEFEKAVEQSQGKVMMIDATKDENKPLVTKMNIKGFPTILHTNGTKYTGSRTADDIVEFAK